MTDASGDALIRFAVNQLREYLGFVATSLFLHDRALLASFRFDRTLANASPQPVIIPFVLAAAVLDTFGWVSALIPHAYFRSFDYQSVESLSCGVEMIGEDPIFRAVGLTSETPLERLAVINGDMESKLGSDEKYRMGDGVDQRPCSP